MTTTIERINDHVAREAEGTISKALYPSFWKRVAAAEISREADLTEALTLHDQPCMSY